MARYKARLILSPTFVDKKKALRLNKGDQVEIKGRIYNVVDTFVWGTVRVYMLDGFGLVYEGELIASPIEGGQ
ncbi:hypothetical protein [Thermoflavimicrobium dichotomicum]|uniref:Uncharacterized protein n=1 Tax=Thermoflavimicrobium dichotomicum TaxID=46223 RepID=A0A1I3ULJ1_9BACL|nr:hypothetical protein [Thermoflavimicrobium dichotomicum]SFJ82736.1 hypothetical protein SAMN05421852_12520 [Thermoflavimicrobium dichotomicum]